MGKVETFLSDNKVYDSNLFGEWADMAAFFKKSIFLAILVGASTLSFSACRLRGPTPEQNKLSAANALPKLPSWLPSNVSKYLKGLDPVLLQDTPPHGAQLRGLDPKNFSNVYSVQENAVANIMDFVKSVPGGGVYFFLGNGMHAPYELLSAMYAGTPLEKRFVYLPMSRPLVRAENNTKAEVHQYLKKTVIDKYKGERMFVYDSTTGGANNNHSLQALTSQLSELLIKEGVPEKQAYKQVIPVAWPESQANYANYGVSDLAAYDKLADAGKIGKNFLPMIVPNQLKWNGVASWSYSGPRWNGKTNVLNKNLEPVGQQTIQALFDANDTNIASYKQLMTSRVEYVSGYLEIIAIAAKLKSKNKTALVDAGKVMAANGNFKFAKPKPVDFVSLKKTPLSQGMIIKFDTGKKYDVGNTSSEFSDDVSAIELVTYKGKGEFIFVAPKSTSAEDKKSFEYKKKGFAALANEGFGAPKIIAESKSYMIISPVSGESAKDFLRTWSQAGSPPADPKWMGLEKLVSSLISNGVYVERLLPENLIWNGKTWQISDFRNVKTGYDPAKLKVRYRDKLDARLQRPLKKIASKERKVSCKLLEGLFQ